MPARGRAPSSSSPPSLTLFVELALIRWLGANVLYLAYFSNVVLLGSFLGIGAGFLWASRRPAVAASSLAPAALGHRSSSSPRVLDVRVGIAGGDLIFFGLDTSGRRAGSSCPSCSSPSPP